jgi:hypothetical protein
MGAGQSSAAVQYANTGASSKDVKRLELFSSIFLRLLQSSDILDIVALTRGPKACGDYVVLLEKDLNKEFNKIKLPSTGTGQSTVDSVIFSRAKMITDETPSDALTCRSLAIFYVRALQLIGALTMSIYTPPDLVTRIQQRVLEKARKEQLKDVVLTQVQKEELRNKQDAWLKNIMTDVSRSDGIMTIQGHPQFKYNKTPGNNILTYVDPENKYEYKAKLFLEEPTKFNIVEYFEGEKIVTPESYWIIVTTATTPPKNIYRALVAKNKFAYVFSPEVDVTLKNETPDMVLKDWAANLPVIMVENTTPRPPPPPSKNAGRDPYGRPVAFGARTENYFGGGRKRRTFRKRGGGPYDNTLNPSNDRSKQATKKNTNEKSKVIEKLSLSKDNTLPRAFARSYDDMVQWTAEVRTWSEAAPASYRAVLLYIKPALPTGQATSYICVDNWAERSLKLVSPFASLESLYYNEDDGSMSQYNADLLKGLANVLNDIYAKNASDLPGPEAPKKKIETLADVSIPPIPIGIKNLFCGKRSAQGNVAILDPRHVIILERAQTAILNLYKAHFEFCYSILEKIFSAYQSPGGEMKVQFAPIFADKNVSARATLEGLISEARGALGEHYVAVEKIYYGALQELLALPIR